MLIVPDAPSFAWQIYEIWIKKCYLFRTGNAHPLIFDVGSNIGMSVLYFKDLYPQAKVIAYEADPYIFNILQHNVSHLENVELHNEAAWTKVEELCFIADHADGGHIDIGTVDLKSQSVSKIHGIRLHDEILKQNQQVNFLKIDIEGAEDCIINDCCDILNMIDNIFIEYHSYLDKEQNLNEILEILTKNGFRYYIASDIKVPHPYVDKCNNVMDLQMEIYAVRK